MITFVTAFINFSKAKRSRDHYKQYFDRVVDTGINIVLFLDVDIEWTFPSNVYVQKVTMADTWVGKNVSDDSIIPLSSNPADTIEYMKIMNTKPEWLKRAAELNVYNTDLFAWIDFGLAHVLSNVYPLSNLQEPLNTMATAGIWQSQSSDVWTNICWRFAGGFIILRKDRIDDFFEKTCDIIQRNQPNFSWEVNIWALLETEGFDFGWYPANHDDSILNYPVSS